MSVVITKQVLHSATHNFESMKTVTSQTFAFKQAVRTFIKVVQHKRSCKNTSRAYVETWSVVPALAYEG